MTSPWLKLALDAVANSEQPVGANSAVGAEIGGQVIKPRGFGTIGTIGTSSQEPRRSPALFADHAGVHLDVASEAERAAVVEHDGGGPRVYADAFARLQKRCPESVPVARWHQFINDGGVFLDAWGHQAVALGWSAADLFGLHETRPLVRHDATGLVWLLKGEHVIALGDTAAKLSGGHVYRRKQAVHPTPTTKQTR